MNAAQATALHADLGINSSRGWDDTCICSQQIVEAVLHSRNDARSEQTCSTTTDQCNKSDLQSVRSSALTIRTTGGFGFKESHLEGKPHVARS